MKMLNAPEIAALREALDDEHRAWATYPRCGRCSEAVSMPPCTRQKGSLP
jgi:hypothetical protein